MSPPIPTCKCSDHWAQIKHNSLFSRALHKVFHFLWRKNLFYHKRTRAKQHWHRLLARTIAVAQQLSDCFCCPLLTWAPVPVLAAPPLTSEVPVCQGKQRGLPVALDPCTHVVSPGSWRWPPQRGHCSHSESESAGEHCLSSLSLTFRYILNLKINKYKKSNI